MSTPSSPQASRSTIRKRTAAITANTQRYLPIAEIRNDTVLLKNGGLRAVLKVEALNFNLKSETEQQGIIAGYGALVNTLQFPLQIVVRSAKTNIDEYLNTLRNIAEKQQNDLLKNQTFSYVSFIERLLDIADIMQKSFFVVVPLDHSARKKTIFEKFFEWLNPDDSGAAASARNREFSAAAKQLHERVELIQTGLGNIGLHSGRLTTRDLIELYYQVYNPKTSYNEKIPKDAGGLNLQQMTL